MKMRFRLQERCETDAVFWSQSSIWQWEESQRKR